MASSATQDYAIVGDCAGCGGQMIECRTLDLDDERRVTLECQDCDAEAELRHDYEDGLEGGSWSGVGDPEIKPVSWIDCPRCHGHGWVKDPIDDLLRAMNGRDRPCPNCHRSGSVPRVVETDGGSESEKEEHRLGTINRWDAPDGDWAAEHDWTRYRGPDPWPVPGGWVFKDPEGGGWWEYFGEAGVGHGSDDSLLEELKDDESVDDPYETLNDERGRYAFLRVETSNPEVARRNPEDEKLEWSLEISDVEVFRRVAPDRSDLMAAVAEGLAAYHEGTLDDKVGGIVPASGQKPKSVLDEERLERRQENNRSLGDYATSQKNNDE